MFPGHGAKTVEARLASPLAPHRGRCNCGSKGEASLSPTVLAPCPPNVTTAQAGAAP
jgi:hypothetical protein